jgi:glycosyltransferase involved in cell wall biosynthesis
MIHNFNSLYSSLDYLSNLLNNNYKFAIVIPTYNRLDMIKKTFDSLIKTNLKNTLLFIIDDNSNKETQDFIKKYEFFSINTIKIFKKENKKMYDSFVMGFDNAIKNYPSIEYLITLDSDTIHKTHWLDELYKIYKQVNEDCIITGFNTSNHKIQKTFKDYYLKESMGGVNMFFHKDLYIKYFRDILIRFKLEWDIYMSAFKKKYNYKLYCTKPSVIQHIGDIGLNSKKSKYDKAMDY